MNYLCHPISIFLDEDSRTRRQHHSAIVRTLRLRQKLEDSLNDANAAKAFAPRPVAAELLLDHAFSLVADLDFILNELHDLYGEPQS